MFELILSGFTKTITTSDSTPHMALLSVATTFRLLFFKSFVTLIFSSIAGGFICKCGA